MVERVEEHSLQNENGANINRKWRKGKKEHREGGHQCLD